MPNLSRRALMRGSASAIAAGAISILPSSSSATVEPIDIQSLHAKWCAIREAESRRLAAIRETMPEDIRLDEERREAWLLEHTGEVDDADRIGAMSDAMAEVEREIAATPARSVADVAIKLQMHVRGPARDYTARLTDEEAYGYGREGSLNEILARSALRDVDRLVAAGKGGAL